MDLQGLIASGDILYAQLLIFMTLHEGSKKSHMHSRKKTDFILFTHFLICGLYRVFIITWFIKNIRNPIMYTVLDNILMFMSSWSDQVYPSKHKTLTQCWINVGPLSATPAQH